MKLKDLYAFIVQRGIEVDPRGKDVVEKDLQRKKENFDTLKPDDPDSLSFDKESFTNPYPDTRILFGNPELEVRNFLIGIDIEVGEILLAERLLSKGKKIDLVISHHPEGRAYANLYEVMHMQADILNKFGVPITVADDLLDKRIKEVERKLMPVNHTRTVDAAKLLGIPLLCMHTPSDNFVANHLQKLFDERKPDTLKDILNILREIPEYQDAIRETAGPKITLGSKEKRAGKVFVDMTGGTEGSKDIFERISQAGVGTIVAMHLSEDHRKEAEKHHVNVVIAGHISSDNLGMNLLLDGIEKAEPSGLSVLCCSGFKRFKRIQ
ncbi:MAG: NGG1p interacting factor NIF3 [Nitrospirota bacterium]